mmetsp:Transcript_4939/g.12361  ORF Transcript_4939/g.12361 Transcript_4939/m.12361 type:complete len:226 (+) Transcript_4939:2368-3045(+)
MGLVRVGVVGGVPGTQPRGRQAGEPVAGHGGVLVDAAQRGAADAGGSSLAGNVEGTRSEGRDGVHVLHGLAGVPRAVVLRVRAEVGDRGVGETGPPVAGVAVVGRMLRVLGRAQLTEQQRLVRTVRLRGQRGADGAQARVVAGAHRGALVRDHIHSGGNTGQCSAGHAATRDRARGDACGRHLGGGVATLSHGVDEQHLRRGAAAGRKAGKAEPRTDVAVRAGRV